MELNSLPYVDRKCVSTLVNEILLWDDLRRLAITVNDGEEDVLDKSRDLGVVLEYMASTDEDYLLISEQHPDGTWLHRGWFRLIYGNGTSPMETISDYGWSEKGEKVIESIYRNVEFFLEKELQP